MSYLVNLYMAHFFYAEKNSLETSRVAALVRIWANSHNFIGITQDLLSKNRVDRNLALYLPRLTVLVSIEADRPEAWFPGPLGPYLTWFPAI